MSRLGFTPGMFCRPIRIAPPKISGGGGSPPAQITDGAATYNGTSNAWDIDFTDAVGVTYTLKDSGATVDTVTPASAITNSGNGAFSLTSTLRIDGVNGNGTTTGANFNPTAPAQTGTANPMQDLFRVAGTLSGKYPDTSGNNTWSTSGGTWTKSGGEAAISGGSGHIWACYDAGISDCTIVSNVHTAASGTYEPGIAFRCVGGLGWYFEIRAGGWYLNYQGTDPVANNATWGATNDTAYELKVVLNGNDMSLYIDNVLIDTITDSRDASSTTHGLHCYDDDNGSNFHDITINA
jgi:hypothetical protein